MEWMRPSKYFLLEKGLDMLGIKPQHSSYSAELGVLTTTTAGTVGVSLGKVHF